VSVAQHLHQRRGEERAPSSTVWFSQLSCLHAGGIDRASSYVALHKELPTDNVAMARQAHRQAKP
jgi:hypothetical protein